MEAANQITRDLKETEKKGVKVPLSRFRMGEFLGSEDTGSCGAAPKVPKIENLNQKLPVVPLVFLIFYEVSGGPFGVEDSVRAGGPLLTLLGFLIFPLIWSVPEALVTAEMATMFPQNSGYVGWISAAFGPFWGFQQGWWKWLSGVIDNALYPVLFLDYLKSAVPMVGNGLPRIIAILAITISLTYLNYRGLTIVSWAAVCLGVFSLLPFCVMFVLAIPRLKPARWFEINMKEVDWNVYLNVLFWNLNYWDSVSTLAGEVENPKRTIPKALFFAVMLVVGSNMIPLLSAIGAIEVVRENWNDGYFADAAYILGGVVLQMWIAAAAALSNMGMFEAEMSSDSFQLLGMGQSGMLPALFAVRSRYGTPLLAIMFSASGVLVLSSLSFQEIVAAENYLYCFGMFAEFAAFIWLRIKKPGLARPYKVPLGTVGVILLCLIPSLLLVLVVAVASFKVMAASISAVLIGFVLWPCLEFVKSKKWLNFVTGSELSGDLHDILVSDAGIGLLSTENTQLF